jgi:hypothetical protein
MSFRQQDIYNSRRRWRQTPACTTTTGRFFITDRDSKHRLHSDTGSGLCVFPRKHVPREKERVNYDHFAAKGTTVPTYRWISLSLNLGLRREFTWRFVVADVQTPIIGVVILAHFGLLVDCRNNRLLDGTKSLSAPAQAAQMPIASVKTIGCGTPLDDLLAELPELTHPTGIQRDV